LILGVEAFVSKREFVYVENWEGRAESSGRRREGLNAGSGRLYVQDWMRGVWGKVRSGSVLSLYVVEVRREEGVTSLDTLSALESAMLIVQNANMDSWYAGFGGPDYAWGRLTGVVMSTYWSKMA
jgi:hypothetical protein